MENHLTDDTFLARWISGELSSEELAVFKKSKDYPIYKKINETSLKLETASYNKQDLFNKILQQKASQEQSKEPKVIKLVPNWVYAVAASVVILFGVFYFISNETHYATDYSEQLAVTLPDHSKVQLNSNSKLDFKSRRWEDNREVMLTGEAFFDVEKGTSFKVLTSEGIIEVLGTEFSITVRDNYFEVQCFEGKVKVTSINTSNETILTQGNAFRIVNNNAEAWNFILDEPNWLHGESAFNNAPLSQVIISLENQFEITFDKSSINQNKRFTGSFTHSNINLALKTVFVPMEISFKPNKENTIIILDTIK